MTVVPALLAHPSVGGHRVDGISRLTIAHDVTVSPAQKAERRASMLARVGGVSIPPTLGAKYVTDQWLSQVVSGVVALVTRMSSPPAS